MIALTTASLDAPFAALQPAYHEHGFAGWSGALPPRGVASGWIPGNLPSAPLAVEKFQNGGGRFRLLFPERYHAPSIEAHKLFTANHLGLPAHLLVRIRVHPALLTTPDVIAGTGWLGEPLLNRLPFVVWMMGRVREARILCAPAADGKAGVILLRHEKPGRLSTLELSISEGVTQAGAPALRERFEATGSDGFVRVNGVFSIDRSAPRIEVHRGPAELVQRDLSREPADIYRLAVERAEKDAAVYCRLTEDYLAACAVVRAGV